jgi:glycosyltransferase involved in cell wall biosynthesis
MNKEFEQPGCRALVIIPAYNEAECIQAVLADLRQQVPWADVVVVDDGSQDNTADLARRAGATVLQLPFNLGVGGAMRTGYRYALEGNYDLAVQFDGDGQHRADQIPPLVSELLGYQADLVIGSRLRGRRSYRFSPGRWFGSRLLVGITWLVTGVGLTDPTSGFRAASKRTIAFFARYYPQSYLGDTVEAVALAARHGMRIREVPARIRMTEHSSINVAIGLVHTIRICLAILIDRVETRFPLPGVEPPPRGPAPGERRPAASAGQYLPAGKVESPSRQASPAGAKEVQP